MATWSCSGSGSGGGSGGGSRTADVMQQEIENGRLLVERATAGDAEGVRDLLRQKVKVNAEAFNMSLYYKSKNYWTPLHHAAHRGHGDVVRILVEEGGERRRPIDLRCAFATFSAVESSVRNQIYYIGWARVKSGNTGLSNAGRVTTDKKLTR